MCEAPASDAPGASIPITVCFPSADSTVTSSEKVTEDRRVVAALESLRGTSSIAQVPPPCDVPCGMQVPAVQALPAPQSSSITQVGVATASIRQPAAPKPATSISAGSADPPHPELVPNRIMDNPRSGPSAPRRS